MARSGLVGRQAERDRLTEAQREAQAGSGSLVLVAGEAGVGKTRLLEETAAAAGGLVLRGGASQDGGAPYAPVIAALRSQLRVEPDALDDLGALRPHLALILPELGPAAGSVDRATLYESIRCAFAHLAADQQLTVVLDDLQWSDEATLELLPVVRPDPVTASA